MEHLEKMSRDFGDITLRGKTIISAVEIQELLYKDYESLPLKRKLEKLRRRILYLIEPYEKRLVDKAVEEAEESGEYLDQNEIVKVSKSLVGGEIKAIVNEVEEKTKFDLMDCYKALYEDLEGFLKMANIKYDNDILVIPAYIAKGLEFDVIMIYNASDLRYKDEEDRLLIYTACTRDLHV